MRTRDSRVLPHSLDAEASILGGVLIRNEVLALLPDVEVDDFYDMRHKVVWQSMRNLAAKSMPIDVVTLEVEIESTGKLDAIGGVGFLGELAIRVPTVDNVVVYAEIVTDKRIRRDVMLTLNELFEEGYKDYSDIQSGEDYINMVTAALMRIRTRSESPVKSIGELLHEEGQRIVKDMEKKARGERVFSGVPTGFMAVDERIGGNPIGIMVMFIARPGTGKTTFAMAMAEASKRIADMDTLIVSYEDQGESFGQRGLAQETGIGTERLRARKLDTGNDLAALTHGMSRMKHRSEQLLFAGGMEVEQLVRRIRREQLRRQMIGLKPFRQIIVDYVQKMPIPKWARNRDEGIGYISRILSTFAATDQLAVVVMSQLNRESEKRDDHRPRLSDIRDSGSLEQDGKVIYGIYYPYGYDPKNHDPGDVSLIVLKNAQGEAMGEIGLYWDRATHAIYNSRLDYQHARSMRGR